jgi:DNA-binding NtrC family response regulator
MAACRFRADLYFRLSVFPIQVPPLRERLEDVTLLATDFLGQAAKRLNLPVPGLTAENIKELCTYDWPGNVRELQNVLERALIRSAGQRLRFDLAPPTAGEMPELASTSLQTRSQLLEWERVQIVQALEKSKGKIYGADGAAASLGIPPTTLSSKIAALKIKRIPRKR